MPSGLFSQRTVEITNAEFACLIRDSERVAALKRLIKSVEYVNVNDIKAILDYKEPDNEKSNE